MRLIVDSTPVAFAPDDTVLTAMLKAGQHPTGGGTLCCGGDCPHCLATVDGVSYIRTCQVVAKPGMIVQRHHLNHEYPPLPEADRLHEEVHAHNFFCDICIIGMGESGQAAVKEAEAAGKTIVTLDNHQGQEVVAIYAGPRVVARTDQGMIFVHVKEEAIVATGAAEIQPVVPGSHLAGLMTARAAQQFNSAGVALGNMVAIGTPPAGVAATALSGELVRFQGNEAGQVTAVVMADEQGNETIHSCDSVSLALGFHPRNALHKMGADLAVRAVGEATISATIPECPTDPKSIVCACSGITLADLDYTWESGFQEMELIKRSTLAGTGTCQGMGCIPYLQSFIQARKGELQPRFTARPVNRQLTMGEISAGSHHHATACTALDAVHRKLGANMERSGNWWRPWNYGDLMGEYWAVREGVSIMDVSTLGKMIIAGPDALEFLERLYPTQVSTIRKGRTRYVLLLNEGGYVMDDGLIGKESDTRYLLTLTSGGTSHSETWIRDWAEGWEMDVRLINQTYTQGAINVTGPLASQLLERAGMAKPMKFMRFADMEISDVPCRVFRLSFTGEASYELHHPAEQSAQLWHSLMVLGADLGIKPHGLEALTLLRLEKGHVIVGQDTDFDSTPRRLHHEWMCKLGKEFFLGRRAVERTNQIPLDKMLVGFELDQGAPLEGAVIWHGDEIAGHVTSAGWSGILGKGIALGWLDYFDGALPEQVTISGMAARRVAVPFYDKEGSRAKS